MIGEQVCRSCAGIGDAVQYDGHTVVVTVCRRCNGLGVLREQIGGDTTTIISGSPFPGREAIQKAVKVLEETMKKSVSKK